MLKGIYTAMVTPFKEDGSMDREKVESLIEAMIADGISGVVIGGSTGEFFLMSYEERKAQVKAICEIVNKRITVVANAGCLNTEDTVDMAKYCTEAGADILLLVPSWYEKLTNDEIVAHYKAVGDAVDTPIMLYNIPGSSSNDITPEVAAQLAEVCNATCMKDSTGDVHRQYQITWATGGKVQPVCGADSILINALAYGTQATVLGVTNAISKECVALCKYMEKNDLDAARKLWDKLLPVLEFAENNEYIAVTKRMCKLVGRDQGDPRRPVLPLNEEKTAKLTELMAGLAEVKDLVDAAFN
ncbi:MAG: dihydrodipicolinate synthase family protein [Eubacterium sp.]|nr:dihydrodipicolinate synthase family protein [Eubacterium sp.]